MTELQRIRKIIDEAFIETSRKATELKKTENYIAMEYFLGRTAGLDFALAIIDSFMNDKREN